MILSSCRLEHSGCVCLFDQGREGERGKDDDETGKNDRLVMKEKEQAKGGVEPHVHEGTEG